ncbi:DUF3298 and DUF4163 domain-containing protein [Altibacter sp.]|uniref:DUF3298 and DUF4163 domain-containing protein n=1 Tax=Altibacter sp. TaxID=2024823 RepID=UPI000C926824|nr:DUF3298 and DUF4163 domain-containing protein [Altibacter sp.]MAP55791.1 hypothetical protein [Altibacter sp.]
MNNKSLVILLLFLIGISCAEEVVLTVSSKNLTEADVAVCTDAFCPEVTVNYVVISGNEEVSEKINYKIASFVINALHLGDPEEAPTAGTISEAITQFIKMYRIHSAEFPDMGAAYFANVSVTETFRSSHLLSFELKHYLFTGGAHGYGSTIYMHIDPLTGAEIHTEALFADLDGFTTFAEKKFREANDIPTSENINATGFWFKEDTFALPEHIGVSEQYIILRYNQYDIASYAAGPIELLIPRKEVETYLQIKS